MPAFDALGFEDALVEVRRQVSTVYEEWQEKPLDADRNGRLAMHLSVYDKLAAAEVLYRRAQALDAGEFRWTYYLAFTLRDLGRLDEATGMFREALRIDPWHLNSRIQLAGLLLQHSDIEGSLNLYRQLTVDHPERVEGWLGLGKTLFRSGDNDAAIEALRRAWALGPQYGEVHYALALVSRARGDEEEAAREFAAYERTSHNKISTSDPLLGQVSSLHAGDEKKMAIASYHYARAKYDMAASSFRAALAINPDNGDAWSGLVSSQVNLGEIDAAGVTYREALAAGIVYARLHLTYGKAMLDRQQLDPARDAIGQAIAINPHDADALSAMGDVEMQSGAIPDAIKQFRLSLLARPNDRDVRLSLAHALNVAGYYDEAAGQLDMLMADPALNRSQVLKELEVAYSMERKDDAIEALQRGSEVARESNNILMMDAIDRLLSRWRKQAVEQEVSTVPAR